MMNSKTALKLMAESTSNKEILDILSEGKRDPLSREGILNMRNDLDVLIKSFSTSLLLRDRDRGTMNSRKRKYDKFSKCSSLPGETLVVSAEDVKFNGGFKFSFPPPPREIILGSYWMDTEMILKTYLYDSHVAMIICRYMLDNYQRSKIGLIIDTENHLFSRDRESVKY